MQVQSSNIAEVDYDDVEQKLYVTFRSGGRWVYLGVPYDVYLGMLTAESVGSYFHHNVRSHYAARRTT